MEPFQLPQIEPPAETEVVGGARPRSGGWGRPAAFAVAGLVAGGVLAGSMSAMAADNGTASPSAAGTSSSSGTGYGAGTPGGTGSVDESQPQRPDEQLLTGDTATKVRAAALAKYPGATVLRVETDSDGVYEAHLVTTDGTRVTVEVGADLAVTGTEAAPAGGPGHGDGDGDGPGGTPPSGSAPGAAPSPSGTA
jgi:hypothetical protein